MTNGADATAPQTLLECLKAFNRKERYWLLRNALGAPDSELLLSGAFRDRLRKLLDTEIPSDAWWAIDYHIDWLFAALITDSFGHVDERTMANPLIEGTPDAGMKRLIRGTQEDFDLVVAFDRTIILIEAKGVTSWGNDQLASKCRRLQEWSDLSTSFEHDGATLKPLDVFMVLASPRRPQKVHQLTWPGFVRLKDVAPFFLPLDLSAAPEAFLVPERCNDQRQPAASGDRWRTRSLPRPELEED